MKRRLLIAAAVIPTLVGLTTFNARAMAGEYHARYAHASAHGHPVVRWRNAARREASIRRAVHVRATHFRAAQFRRPRQLARRR
jgi:hypothetical protein